jgi:hypothetical protein
MVRGFLFLPLSLLAGTMPALAQGNLAVRAGGNVNPDQLYAGAQYLMNRVRKVALRVV